MLIIVLKDCPIHEFDTSQRLEENLNDCPIHKFS